MTPYYESGGITIYHGDCREILPTLKADVVVTDPPYGIGIDDAFVDDFEVGVWGFENAPGRRAAVFHSPRRVVEFINAINSWTFERLLWMNKVAGIKAPWRGWCMNGEAITIFSRTHDDWPVPPHYGPDCYTARPLGKNGHPCAKPLGVVSNLIDKLSHSHDIILDPFAGSGTTGVAAFQLGRKAVLIESEERWCALAARRIDALTPPMPLEFVPKPKQEVLL